MNILNRLTYKRVERRISRREPSRFLLLTGKLNTTLLLLRAQGLSPRTYQQDRAYRVDTPGPVQ